MSGQPLKLDPRRAWMVYLVLGGLGCIVFFNALNGTPRVTALHGVTTVRYDAASWMLGLVTTAGAVVGGFALRRRSPKTAIILFVMAGALALIRLPMFIGDAITVHPDRAEVREGGFLPHQRATIPFDQVRRVTETGRTVTRRGGGQVVYYDLDFVLESGQTITLARGYLVPHAEPAIFAALEKYGFDFTQPEPRSVAGNPKAVDAMRDYIKSGGKVMDLIDPPGEGKK